MSNLSDLVAELALARDAHKQAVEQHAEAYRQLEVLPEYADVERKNITVGLERIHLDELIEQVSQYRLNGDEEHDALTAIEKPTFEIPIEREAIEWAIKHNHLHLLKPNIDAFEALAKTAIFPSLPMEQVFIQGVRIKLDLSPWLPQFPFPMESQETS